MLFNRLERIFGTGWIESAGRRLERRNNFPIDRDEEKQRKSKEPFHLHSGIKSGLAE